MIKIEVVIDTVERNGKSAMSMVMQSKGEPAHLLEEVAGIMALGKISNAVEEIKCEVSEVMNKGGIDHTVITGEKNIEEVLTND